MYITKPASFFTHKLFDASQVIFSFMLELNMTFYIDAWLDRPQPYVQVKNKENKKVVVDFSSDELKRAIEQGDICLCDFFDSSLETQTELVKSLILLRCSVDMGKKICRELFTPRTSYH